MKTIIETTKFALLSVVAWIFAVTGVAITQSFGFAWRATHRAA